MHGHPLVPAELATNPGIHASAIGVIIATWRGVLPDLALLMPVIYYALLIADHLIDRFGKKKPHRRHPHVR